MKDETKDFITFDEAADALGISPSDIWRLVREGRLRRRPVDGVPHIPCQNVIDLINGA